MWIRSQDKTVLVEVNEICIEEKTKIWSDGYLIGKYSTEEKALKVLDEIQELIYFNAKDNGFTYQMPKDDEVRE